MDTLNVTNQSCKINKMGTASILSISAAGTFESVIVKHTKTWMPPLKTTTAIESRQHSAKGRCSSRVEHWNSTYSFTTWISLPVSQIFFFSQLYRFSRWVAQFSLNETSRDSHYINSWGWYSCRFRHPLHFLFLFHKKLRIILPTIVYTNHSLCKKRARMKKKKCEQYQHF